LAKSSIRNRRLESVDDLFGTEETRADDRREKVMDIPLSEISDFPDHPFRVLKDDAMLRMAESVKLYGILHPVLVRSKADGGYEMIAGHRRKLASELAGRETIPCIVRELTDDESIIAMVDSNIQRETLLPSEKALAYKMKIDALKRQGTRTDLTSPQVAAKFRSDDAVAQQANISGDTVRRYIRLTELIPPLMELVDEKKIAFSPAVELSYLDKMLQADLHDVIEKEECTPSLSQAQRLKTAAQEGKLDRNGIELVMSEEKPQQNNLTIKSDILDKFFPKEFTPKQKEDIIIKLLDKWHRSRQQEHER
jgi:ParB family chromosome partitioning protein